MKATTTTKPVTQQTVLRNVLTKAGKNMVMLAPGARVTAVQVHPQGVEIFTLASGIKRNEAGEIQTDGFEPRRFWLARTGETIAEAATYLATTVLPHQPALHVFELL